MPGTAYQCIDRDCSAERTVPERPSDAPRTIRMGCPECGYPRTFYRVGHPHPYRPVTSDL